jgi:hypothetical protein
MRAFKNTRTRNKTESGSFATHLQDGLPNSNYCYINTVSEAFLGKSHHLKNSHALESSLGKPKYVNECE